MSLSDLADPRVWPDAGAAPAWAAEIHAAVASAIDAETSLDADLRNGDVKRLLEAMLATTHGRALADAFAAAPSAAIARHLWRLLADVEQDDGAAHAALRTTLFAMPVILVTALDAGSAAVTLSGVLAARQELEELLRESRAFGGCETFALSDTLIGADAIDIPALPALLTGRNPVRLADAPPLPPLDFPPAPIEITGAGERVFLRFIAGAVLTPAGADPLRDTHIARWGMRVAQRIAQKLTAPGATLLALPRAPQRLVPALKMGRAAQREASAQVFASNAIRKLRASVGEPTAIVSAHRAADAPGGGELRLSLSSPFAPRDAEGFRCPLYPYEPVHDAAAMLVALLTDCQVTGIRIRAGVHADRDPASGAPLLFKDCGSTPTATPH